MGNIFSSLGNVARNRRQSANSKLSGWACPMSASNAEQTLSGGVAMPVVDPLRTDAQTGYRRSSRSTVTGRRFALTTLHFSPHQGWSGWGGRVSASGKPSIAIRRSAVLIDLACTPKGKPGDLVDDDRGCESPLQKAGFVSPIRRPLRCSSCKCSYATCVLCRRRTRQANAPMPSNRAEDGSGTTSGTTL